MEEEVKKDTNIKSPNNPEDNLNKEHNPKETNENKEKEENNQRPPNIIIPSDVENKPKEENDKKLPNIIIPNKTEDKSKEEIRLKPLNIILPNILEDKPKEENIKNYDNLEEKRILKNIDAESKEKKNQQRFGYFSIPYPQVIGDKAYSLNKEYHHKVIDRKVITENRGIYVQGPKTGNGPDACFPPPESTKFLKEQKEKDKKIREEKEKFRKELEKLEEEKLKEKNPFQFKPGGPQMLLNFYKGIKEDDKTLRIIKRIKPNLDKEKKEFDKSDKEESESKKEKDKNLFHFKPGGPQLVFGFYKELDEDKKTKNLIDRLRPRKPDLKSKKNKSYVQTSPTRYEEIKKLEEKNKIYNFQTPTKEKNVEYKPAFKPASLKLCSSFASDRDTFRFNTEKEILDLLKQYKINKEIGNKRYEPPPNPVKHEKPFSPAKMIFNGRDGLFMYKSEKFYLNTDERYTKEYQLKEKRKKENEIRIPIRDIREIENQNKKKPFTYNRLMKSCTFAPPISSYMVNIKKDFPSLKFH